MAVVGGITVRGDGLGDDEVRLVDGMPVTTPLRTALDLACWYPQVTALQCLDALARATAIDAVGALTLAANRPEKRGCDCS